MTVIADITIPPETMFISHILEDLSGVEIEFERVVPLRERIIPLVWVGGADPASLESRLADHDYAEDVQQVMSDDDRTLFELQWSDDVNGVVNALLDAHVTVLQATGNEESWNFSLRFPTHEHLSNFGKSLTERGISVTLHHLYNPTPVVDEPGLSPEQTELLVMAYQRGYYDVPRRTNLAELATEVGITDSALSQRLRRAMSQLVEQSLLSGRPGELR